VTLSVYTDMSLATGPTGRPAIQTVITQVEATLSSGGLCSGGTAGTGAEVDESASGKTVEFLKQITGDATPPLESEGLDFGGLVKFVDPRLIAIETDGDPSFADYIAITGTLAP